ncbi:zinc ribbon domain-containing protein [Winogradskyella sp.]|uniref:double zinc ribbon domain-containing protein n=1 Tax=Winogradskyella sp. TaxID=1883156 RepID=UPI0025EA8F90|nr:zinc ribbon domain-containing protein [Winogradskyella sp.]
MKKIHCSNCGSEISKDTKFCGNCGGEINLIEIKTNICPRCDYVGATDENYCPECGIALTLSDNEKKTPNSQFKVAEIKKPRPVAKTTTTLPIKKKKEGFFRTLGKVTLWIFGIGVLGVVALYFIGDNIDSSNTLESAPSTLTDITFNPEPVIGSGTKVFEIEPITGVILKAKQGVLDKNRDFKVEKLSDDQVKEIAENLTNINAVPLKGIYIDSGMEDDEIFSGTLDVELSLSEFKIPASMADYLCIIRTESDGTSAIIPSHVENDQISFETERNSVFLMGLLVAVGTSSVTFIAHTLQKDGVLDDEYKIDASVYKKGFSVINNVDGYSLYYPARMPKANPTEVNRVEAILADILKRNKIQASETHVNLIKKSPDLMMKLWNVLQKDQEFLEVQKLLNDEQWKQDNLWPQEVTEIVKTLRLADSYLFGNMTALGRGFKRYDNIDIIALDEWPSSSLAPAISRNPISKQPYVLVNVDHIFSTKSPEFKKWSERLLPTMVHEIFHTCQVRYLGTFVADRDKYLWFWEATAITVEKQAREYFENQQIIPHDKMTISLENSNYCQKDFAFLNGYSERTDLQNQGYTYATLIEYISNQYAVNTGKPKEKYINYALEKFAELRDARATLIKTTTNSNHGFEELYKNYCHESLSSFILGYAEARNAKFPFPTTVNLTKGSPVTTIDNNYESLSLVMRKFNVLGADMTKDNSVKLVLRGTVGNVMRYSDGFSIATTSNEENENYRVLKQPNNMSTDEFDVEIGFGTAANNNSFFLQDVNYDMDKSVHRSYEVFAMYKPATPSLTFNQATEERWYLTIQYKKSNLKKEDYVDEYKITMRCPNGDIYSFITEENKLELPTSYDRQTLSSSINNIDNIHSIELIKAGGNSTITGNFDLLYRELTSSDAKVMGPQSMAVRLAVDGVVDLTADADELSIDETISYKVTVTPDKSNYTYYWYIDGHVDQEGSSSSSSSSLQVNFEKAGTYTAKVTVRDENGKNIGSDNWTCIVTSEEINSITLVAYYERFNFKTEVMYKVEAHEITPGYDVFYIVKEGENMANNKYKYKWIVNGVKDNSAGNSSKWGNNFALKVEHEARDWSAEIKGGVIGIGSTTVCVEVFDKNDRFIGKDCWTVNVKEPVGEYLNSPVIPDGDEDENE